MIECIRVLRKLTRGTMALLHAKASFAAIWQGIDASEVAALAEENAQLRRQLAERQHLAALREDADAPPQLHSSSHADAIAGQRQRVLGLDGTWVEQTWVMVSSPEQLDAVLADVPWTCVYNGSVREDASLLSSEKLPLLTSSHASAAPLLVFTHLTWAPPVVLLSSELAVSAVHRGFTTLGGPLRSRWTRFRRVAPYGSPSPTRATWT